MNDSSPVLDIIARTSHATDCGTTAGERLDAVGRSIVYSLHGDRVADLLDQALGYVEHPRTPASPTAGPRRTEPERTESEREAAH
ncbi:hypothetical protein [Streptacidiphilus neutrinimicus]|uniref:hypothetical protein n=1 Tax=Streptacidiphilus neutrinimicus TaxID=105420 RepID=UPI0005A661CC|nr:hypothetical protein [Streptacidiphilus neutrinimicus]